MPNQLYEFDPAKPFRDELIAHYVIRIADWYLTLAPGGCLLPRLSGSNWECAHAIEFLFEFMAFYDVGEERRERIEAACASTALWLASTARSESATESSWDSASWDTASALRGMSRARYEMASRFTAEELKEFDILIARAALWLTNSLDSWGELDVHLTGPSDVAQVLETFTYLRDKCPGVIEQCKRERSVGKGVDGIKSAVSILEHLAEVATISRQSGSVSVVRWVQPLQTAEAVEALSGYLIADYDALQRSEECARITQLVSDGLTYIECSHNGGRWGDDVETAGTLASYLAARESLEIVRAQLGLRDGSPQNEMIFKSLRWMCDKQVFFEDGSLYHTGYATVYAAKAMVRLCRTWKPALNPTVEVYDLILWSSSNSTSYERSMRLKSESEAEALSVELGRLRYRLSVRMRIVSSTVIAVVLFIAAVLVAFGFDAISISIDLVDRGAFLAVMTLCAALGGTLITVLWGLDVRGWRRRQ